MSAAEEEAKPLLSEAFFGTTIAWDSSEQLAVARWAYKTALMVDRSSKKGGRVPEEHFKYLFAELEPPSTVNIALGFYRPLPEQSPLALTAGIRPGSVPASYAIGFSVGQVIFLVAGHNIPGRRTLAVERWGDRHGLVVPMSSTFPVPWPRSTTTFVWPPPDGFAIHDEGLPSLTGDALIKPVELEPRIKHEKSPS